MNLKEALSILKENNYKTEKKMLNESDLRFDSADQFLSFTQSKGYYQNSVKIANINTMLNEKELNDTGKDIGEIVVNRYCKKFESNKKDLQEAWELGWKAEDPSQMPEETFKKIKSKKAIYEECNEVYQKGAIMHAFLNNF